MTYALRIGVTTLSMFQTWDELMNEVNRLETNEYEIDVLEAPMKAVKNILSGNTVIIPVDTPMCCDPSSELFHSM